MTGIDYSGGVLSLERGTLVMGVVNVTPDSFSDGGKFLDTRAAIAHGLLLAAEGAAILDIGGESTRPGAPPVGQAEEIDRTAPVIEALSAQAGVPVSIDTSKAAVARAAIQAGATIVNDVSAGTAEPEILQIAAEAETIMCLMHMQGTPRTMQANPKYDDVVEDVRQYLSERADAAVAAGIARQRLVLDPGIGFGKRVEHNLTLLHRLDRLVDLGLPVMVGSSRKSFIGVVLGGLSVEDRMEGTAATVAIAIARGASIVRVHDVRAMVRVARMTDAIIRRGAAWTEPT